MSTTTPNTTMLTGVRLAFPHLTEPSQFDGKGLFRRNASFIIDGADTPLLNTVKAAIARAAEAKWPDAKKRAAIMAGLERKDAICLHDGVTKAQYDGFDGNFYVAASAPGGATPEQAGEVTLLDQYKQRIPPGSGKLYAGCYVNALVEIYAQDNNYGQRINAVLKGVQFVRDGDAFGAGPPASEDDFEIVADGAAAEDFV